LGGLLLSTSRWVAHSFTSAPEQTLANLSLLLSASTIYCYDPEEAGGRGAAAPPPRLRELQLPTAKRLMRRYYLLQVAKEARVVGILIGTLSAKRAATQPAPPFLLVRRPPSRPARRARAMLPRAAGTARRCSLRSRRCAARRGASTTSS